IADLADVGALEHVEELILPGLHFEIGHGVQSRLLADSIAGRVQVRQGRSRPFSTNSHAPTPTSAGNGTTSAPPIRRIRIASRCNSASAAASDCTRTA